MSGLFSSCVEVIATEGRKTDYHFCITDAVQEPLLVFVFQFLCSGFTLICGQSLYMFLLSLIWSQFLLSMCYQCVLF